MLELLRMNAREFLNSVGTEKAKAVAKRAGTTLGYIQNLAYQAGRRPSAVMAIRLEKASDGVMTRADLRPDLWAKGAAA